MYTFKECKTREEIRMSYRLRHDIFCSEKRWIDSNRFPDLMEHDEFDEYSAHFIAINSSGEAVGTARLIRNSGIGLPIEKVLNLRGFDLDKVAEVSRLSVLKQERNNQLLVFFGLTRLLWRYLDKAGITEWGAVADRHLYNLLKRIKMPFVLIGSPIYYMGSESLPVIVNLARTKGILFNPFVNELLRKKGCEKVA